MGIRLTNSSIGIRGSSSFTTATSTVSSRGFARTSRDSGAHTHKPKTANNIITFMISLRDAPSPQLENNNPRMIPITTTVCLISTGNTIWKTDNPHKTNSLNKPPSTTWNYNNNHHHRIEFATHTDIHCTDCMRTKLILLGLPITGEPLTKQNLEH